jgi:hypothetical protein
MFKHALILIFIFLLMACQNKSEQPTIDKLTYKNILKETLLTHTVTQELHKDSLKKNLLSLVYKKYGVDSLQLSQTTDYYSQHPDELQHIYQEIYNELKHISDSLENLKSVNHKTDKKDSIKVLKAHIKKVK